MGRDPACNPQALDVTKPCFYLLTNLRPAGGGQSLMISTKDSFVERFILQCECTPTCRRGSPQSCLFFVHHWLYGCTYFELMHLCTHDQTYARGADHKPKSMLTSVQDHTSTQQGRNIPIRSLATNCSAHEHGRVGSGVWHMQDYLAPPAGRGPPDHAGEGRRCNSE